MIRLAFAIWSLAILSSGAISLKPGERFPELVFPPIEGGDAVAVSSFAGQKLMLHLFASW
jgi:hypothetical protein